MTQLQKMRANGLNAAVKYIWKLAMGRGAMYEKYSQPPDGNLFVLKMICLVLNAY